MNVNAEVQNLRISQKYFFSIKKKVYANYWFKKKDPDGKLRNRILDFEKEKNIFKRNNQSLIKIINILNPQSVLDVGCGPGFLLSILKKKIKKVVGAEVDEVAAKKAQEFAKVYICDLNKKFNFGKNVRVKSSFGKSTSVKRTNFKSVRVKLKQINSEIKYLLSI